MFNNKNINFITTFLIIAVVSLFVSCKKTPTAPPVKPIATGPSITIQQLRSMYSGSSYKFTSNTILNAVVTMDESSGQLYKQVYVRDNSGTFSTTNYYGAISLRFLYGTANFLTQGDSIAVNLNGATLNQSSGGSLELDSMQAIDCVVKLKSGLNPKPLVVTLPQLNTFQSGQFIYDGQLIQLNDVEFINPNVGTTYAIAQAPPAAPQNVNKYVCDFAGHTIVAYNSGYANFAKELIPSNSGTITAVANLYTTMQLSLRSYVNGDLNLSAPYTPIVYDTLTQNFSCAGLYKNTTVMTAGWQNFDLQGSLSWQGAQYGFYPNWKYSPSVSNYKTTTPNNDIWLVSPPIIDADYAYSAGFTKKIDFSSAISYATPAKLLSVWVSRTFDGTHLIPSQWSDITPFFNNINQSTAPANFSYAHNTSFSGNKFAPFPVTISVGGTPSQYFYLAFRYKTNVNVPDSTGSTYYLGNLYLRNN